MAKWSSEGVETLPSEPGSLVCSTTHLSIFGAVVEVLLTLGKMKAAGNEPKHEVNGRRDKFGVFWGIETRAILISIFWANL